MTPLSLSLCSLCVIMCTFPTKQTRQESRLAGAQLLIVVVCSSAKRALMRLVGERRRMRVVHVAQEANFISSLCSSLDKSSGAQKRVGVPPHIIGGFCGAISGGLVYREGTETGFCSIMHDNKSQRPVVYCGKLLWPK